MHWLWLKKIEMSSEQNGIPEKLHETIFEELDISAAWDSVSMKEIVIERLKQLDIYSETILMRGFNGKKIEKMRKSGIDTVDSREHNERATFFSKVDEFIDPESSDESAFDFAMDFIVPGLAVYDGSKFVE